MTVRESDQEIVLLQGHEELARHVKLGGSDVRRQSTLEGHERRGSRPKSVLPEEERLKALGAAMIDYLARLNTLGIVTDEEMADAELAATPAPRRQCLPGQHADPAGLSDDGFVVAMQPLCGL